MAEPRRSIPTFSGVAGARLLIVEARFYDDIGEMQLLGARSAVEAAGATCDVLSMPGALEIPAAMAIAVDQAALAGNPYDGVVALGCIIRGETYHFEIVSNESARALMDLSVSRKLPLGNGILTVENEEQAVVRADPAQGDKGGDAVRAALALVSLVRSGGAR
ncbi:MAG: 6,7-dimethyl-8-ribityllumazine synthase [Beijerinckiaceae bacterium]|jgi:6,7-dimethyl-8-ribityllumazine synthase|nr:6,7-dimethyl-8-ribityllumazine synthase [Beijerinckiaceae bacterium]MDO9442469.1 6,7-dimethyl-8-ribityllumazine synthase [Beijerinckiaceae bacterium]